MTARARALLALAVLVLITSGVLALLGRGDGGERSAAAADRAAGSQAAPGTAAPTPTPTPPPPAPVEDHLAALARVAEANGDTRAAGTPGDRASVDYVAGRLEAAGYRVERQAFGFPFYRELAPPRIVVGGRRLARADGLATLRFSGAGRVTGRVRAAGVAGTGPSGAGCDAERLPALRRGDIALLGRGVCTLRRKALTAQAAGAAAVLIANDGTAGRTGSFPGTLGSPGVRLPVVGVSRAVGERIAAAGRATVVVRTESERRRTVNVSPSFPDGQSRRRCSWPAATSTPSPRAPASTTTAAAWRRC